MSSLYNNNNYNNFHIKRNTNANQSLQSCRKESISQSRRYYTHITRGNVLNIPVQCIFVSLVPIVLQRRFQDLGDETCAFNQVVRHETLYRCRGNYQRAPPCTNECTPPWPLISVRFRRNLIVQLSGGGVVERNGHAVIYGILRDIRSEGWQTAVNRVARSLT